MRTLVLLLLVSLCFNAIDAQINQYDMPAQATFINTYVSPNYDMLYLMGKAMKEKKEKEKYDYFVDLAYKYASQKDAINFIQYSNYALQTGWYNSKLYYDRGRAFEYIRQYKLAKKEYKKAYKKGYYKAKEALNRLKKTKKQSR